MSILLAGIIIGVVGAILRSLYHRQPPVIPDLKLIWLVLIGFALQYFIFFEPRVSSWLSTTGIGILFVISLCLLTIFAWANRNEAGFWLLGLGLLLNLLVIASNGGLMPISPETIAQLNLPPAYLEHVQIGQPLSSSKDIVLPQAKTWFWWLSDTFILPDKWLWWRPVGIAFSLGDVLVSLGAMRFFWMSAAGDEFQPTTEKFAKSTFIKTDA